MVANVPGLIGRDISGELWREYVGSDGRAYRITAPVALYYRDGGSTHRVVDAMGITYCVAFPSGYGGSLIGLRWKNKDGSPATF